MEQNLGKSGKWNVKEFGNKKPGITGLVSKAHLGKKVKKVKNEISHINDLVKKLVFTKTK